MLGKLLPYLAIGLDRRARSLGARRASSSACRSAAASLLLVGALVPLPDRRARPRHLHLGGRAQSQLLATQIAMVVTFLPAFLLSGFMFAIDEHAAAAAGHLLPGAGALLPRGDARHLPQGRRRSTCCGAQGAAHGRSSPCVGPGARGARVPQGARDDAARALEPRRARWCARSCARCSATRGCARMIFVAPIIQLLIFGYAVSTDVRDTRDVRRRPRPHARPRASWSTRSPPRGYFRDRRALATGPRDLVDALDHGRAIARRSRSPRGFAARPRAPARRARCRSWSTAPTRTSPPWRRATPSASCSGYGARARADRAARAPASTCASAPGSTPTSTAATTTCRRWSGMIMLLM